MNIFRTGLKLSGVIIASSFFATSGFSQANLTPYKPTGWSDKIVVATITNSTTDSSPLSTTNTLYVDWAVINSGTASAGSFSTGLYVDGVLKQSWGSGSLPVSSYTFVTNYPIGALSAGSHTVTITADINNTVAESNESDNSYTKNITITQATAPAPILLTPTNNSPAQSTTPAFSWSAVSGAAGYRILIATNAADLPTNATASAGGNSVMVNTTVTNNSFTPVEQLDPATTYYWEVHVYNNNDIGTWSAVNSFTTSPSPSGLTIIPTFDSSITNDPQAAQIEATINAALAVYQANFSDPITVHITFKEMATGLGLSSASYYQTISYSSYRAALVSHATTPDDSTMLANLPSGGLNPVNGNANVNLKDPLARALGFTANPPGGQPDGIVNLNTSIMNLTESNTDTNKYSLFSTVSHEVDEVLGFGSALNGLANGAAAPTNSIWPEDLFRFDAAGNRSFTTDVNAASYFSLDGTTDLARFNQNQSGDFSDWYSLNGNSLTEVQDAFLAPDTLPALNVELRVLDSIGYTRVLPQFSIVASAGSNGAISPAGTVSKSLGASQLFIATPASGYLVSQWLLDATVAQTGGTNYTLANIQSNHTLQVTFVTTPKTNQTINFAALPNKALGEPPFAVTATASSGLPVSFSILSGPATISAGTIMLNNNGTVVVQASQAGNTNYNAATNVTQSFTVFSPPGIGLAVSNQNLVLSWPTNVGGFTLRSATNLSPTAIWTNVTPTPVIVNGQYVVTNTFSGKAKFYKLVK